MTRKYWLYKLLVVVAACGSTITGADAAAPVRTVHSAGVAKFVAVSTGHDGLQNPEFAPTFDGVPALQDGPDVSGNAVTTMIGTSTKSCT